MTDTGAPPMVWVEDRSWKLAAPTTKHRCRWTGPGSYRCAANGVAALNRSPDPGRDAWWHYCADHMFGRIIVTHRVGAEHRRIILHAVRVGSSDAARGWSS